MKSFFFSLLLLPLLAPTPEAQVPWHLDRIDQASPVLDGLFTPDCQTGTPTTVYIVGKPINPTLPEFGNRAHVGLGSSTSLSAAPGTGIASLVGGSIHGVDKTANLVSVQVLDDNGNGSAQDVLAGLQWIRDNHNMEGGNAVVCCAFPTGFNAAILGEVTMLGLEGLTVVMPAGDFGQGACSSFPGVIPGDGLPDPFIVGATDQLDSKANFSNYGSCLDLFAPGVGVESGVGSIVDSTIVSAAITAGAASLWLRVNGSADPADVKAGLIADATPDAVNGSLSGAPNLLLQVPDDCNIVGCGGFFQTPWHLDRINQAGLPLDGVLGPDCWVGTPSTVFIISNGIDTTLPEFGGRASVGYGSPTDVTGQGTYLASLVGGALHGVDKTAQLVSVQASGSGSGSGPGSMTAFMDALEWIEDQAWQWLPPGQFHGVVLIDTSAVISSVLLSHPVEDGIAALVDTGLTVVCAAGDQSNDACAWTSLTGPGVVVVGSTAQDDVVGPYSQTGVCIDLYAPGVDVKGAAPGGGCLIQTSTNASAALVAGAAALLQRVGGPADPAAVEARLIAEATHDAILFMPGHSYGPNRLLRVTGDCNKQVPWYLDRIDQAGLPMDGVFTPDCQTGTPTTVYIVDSGIDTDHPEFGGRASFLWGADMSTTMDLTGHGTGVASLVGGSIHGVDKTAKLVSVQVIGAAGSGSWSDMLEGLVRIQTDHASGTPGVVLLALGGNVPPSPYDVSLPAAIASLTDAGLTVVTPAGNSDGNACSFFPAMVPETITVGATDQYDAGASFSNYGPCLDLFAPGVDIERAVTGGVVTQSSSDFSAALVAGAASLWLRVNGAATPADVKAGLIADATSGAVPPPLLGSPNLLLRVSDGCPVVLPPCVGSTVSTPLTFLIDGLPNGTDWWWSLSDSGLPADYVHVPGVSDDYNGDGSFDVKDVVDAFKDSINAFSAANNWLGVSAKCESIGGFEYLSVSSTCSSLSLFVNNTGDPSHDPSDFCKVTHSISCSFNPQIELIPLPGWDCNENGIDDELDLASGLSQDANANGILDECEPSVWSNEGSALTGINGDPLFVGSGDLTAGSSNPLELSNAAPTAVAALFLNLESDPVDVFGGTIVPGVVYSPYFFMTTAAGEVSLNLVPPPGWLPAGTELWLQWVIQDSAAVHNRAMSNAIKGVFP
ncbi:MAG: hypothetical protein DRQ55_18675 [Planctomycetota bacterium]|nr:MAG: hypothetical protein DRQ55_18675 [Planctomycetota bacterium]